MNQELITKAKAAKSVEELIELARASGVELSKEQAKEYFAKLNPPKGELSDDELSHVSGGMRPLVANKCSCPKCKSSGSCIGTVYECKKCGCRWDIITGEILN